MTPQRIRDQPPPEYCDVPGLYATLWPAVTEGLLWEPDSDEARRPLYDLDSVVDVRGLARLANARAHLRTIAVTFVSVEYSSVGRNWVNAMRRIGNRAYVAVAGDRGTLELLRRLGAASVVAHVARQRASCTAVNAVGFTRKGVAMNALKFPIVRALLAEGLNVILCDADAVWLQDPLTLLDSTDADIAFQRVVYFPSALVARWGFAACSGFVYFRSGADTIRFVDTCIDEHRRVQDDQVAFNLALLKVDTAWEKSTAFDPCIHTDRQALVRTFLRASRDAIIGRAAGGGLALLALPHDQFWRHEWVTAERSSMYVCHPNSPKDAARKMVRLSELDATFE